MTESHFISYERRDVLRMLGTAAVAVSVAPSVFAAAGKVKIGTIGAGHIGQTLGGMWLKSGHEVMFSSRHPEELKPTIAPLGAHAHIGTVAEAIAYADVILLAIPYLAMPDFCKEYGKSLVAKACVLDATNPREYREKELAIEALKVGAAQYTANLLPGVRIVRCYNNLGGTNRIVEGSTRPDGNKVGLPIAGEDKNAIAIASELVRETGFEPVLVGGVKMGNYLVPETPLAGVHTAEEIRKIMATLK